MTMRLVTRALTYLAFFFCSAAGLSADDWLLCNSGRPSDAAKIIVSCTAVIKTQRQDQLVIAYRNRAQIYVAVKQYKKAIEDYTKALEIDPKNERTFDMRGEAYVYAKEFDKAILDFTKAINLAKREDLASFSYQWRGYAYEQKGDAEKAVADYTKYAILYPPLAHTVADRIARLSKDGQAPRATVATKPQAVAREQAIDAAVANRRIALIIANTAYVSATPLNNTVADARAFAASLRRLGFTDVIERYDLTAQRLRDELKSFGDKAATADWAVVYFAGHGIQVNQQTYLVPTDAKLARAAHADDEAIPLSHVLSKVEDARQLRLVILDACRENPFLSRMEVAGATRSLGRGLAKIEPSRGVLVAYAARDGQVAQDGDGPHSPFTAALLEHLEEPGLEIGLLFRKVRDSVLKRTSGAQEPYTYGSMPSEEMYFKAAAR